MAHRRDNIGPGPRRNGRQFKNTLYEQFARIGKAVASPRRLELLDLLSQGERTVEALADQAGMSVANTSQHLQVLRAARLVDAEKHGLYVTYRLASQDVVAFVERMKKLAESNFAEIEVITRECLSRRHIYEAVDRDSLRRKVRAGEVTVIDVRPGLEYRAGHIPGAAPVPLEELDDFIDGLPRDQEVVAYCRGPYCLLAFEAVERLLARGYRAYRLEDGVNEWRALGYPIERSA